MMQDIQAMTEYPEEKSQLQRDTVFKNFLHDWGEEDKTFHI